MPLGIARHIITYSGAWSPATSITPAFWIDASDTSSYSVSGSNVTAVTDKAGNATITVGGTPNITNLLDGKNTFAFQQNNNEDLTTNEFLKRDYAVSSSETSDFDGELDLDSLSSNRISTTIGNAQNFDSGIAKNTWKIIGVFFNKAGNQIGARVDGANAFTPVNDYDNSLTPNLDLRIMRNRTSVRLSGKMAEFFSVADVPGTGVINMDHFESAEGYLAHKWGLEGLLPADHPHKANAP